MKKISFRDKKSYVGQTGDSNYPESIPANPFNPNAGDTVTYEGSGDEPVCPDCKMKLFSNENKDVMTCPVCQARYSKKSYDSSYSERGMNPGLFNLDGSNTNNPSQGINYHPENATGLNSGSWTGNLGQ